MESQTATPPAVEVTGLVKRYGDLVAVDGLNLTIAQGEVLGLLGPNGSGKTTTLNCILQLLTYHHGDVRLFGEEMTATAYHLKRRIGVIPQEIAVFEELTVWENVDAFCSLYVTERSKRRELVARAIEFVGLEKFTKYRPRKLSGGLRRRLNIACGIAHNPDLIILDEPTVAVDPQSRNSILTGIKALNQAGATIIYTSHYMEEVEELCRRIVIMDRGKQVATGTASELKSLIATGERIVLELVNPTNAAVEAVRRLDRVRSAELIGEELTVECTAGTRNLADVLHALDGAGVEYGRVTSAPPSLNEVFLEITGRDLRDGA